jgi:hypothetical protein
MSKNTFLFSDVSIRLLFLFLACHYDTLITLEGFVGAIDAAVPCAQILDLARALTPYIHRKNTE